MNSLYTRRISTRSAYSVSPTLKLLFFLPSLLLSAGGFVLQLSGGDLTVAPDVEGGGSILSQAVLGVTYLLGVFILASSGKLRTTVFRAWPLFAIPALALLSTLWSDDPALALRRAVALTGTVVFGLAFASVCGYRECLGIVIKMLTLAMILSLICVVVTPSYGVHQFSDAVQKIHAGSWRGIFAHRNTLGQWASITLALQLIYGGYAFSSLSVRLAAVSLTVICLVGSNSGTGYVLAVLMPIIACCLVFIGRQPNKGRFVVILFLLLCGLFLYTVYGELFELILWSTGKTSDLTGRTFIWHYVTQLIDSNVWFGRGYFSGFVTIDKMISAVTSDSYGSAHNGYLEILVYFGYVGLTLAAFMLIWLALLALARLLSGRPADGVVNSFPMCVVCFILIYNTVESGLMTPNSLLTLLLASIAGMLVYESSADAHAGRVSSKSKSAAAASAR